MNASPAAVVSTASTATEGIQWHRVIDPFADDGTLTPQCDDHLLRPSLAKRDGCGSCVIDVFDLDPENRLGFRLIRAEQIDMKQLVIESHRHGPDPLRIDVFASKVVFERGSKAIVSYATQHANLGAQACRSDRLIRSFAPGHFLHTMRDLRLARRGKSTGSDHQIPIDRAATL
jgi:hypothetical protein